MNNRIQTYTGTTGPLAVGLSDFFLLYFALNPVSVTLMKQGQPVFRAVGIVGGLSWKGTFDTVNIDTETTQAKIGRAHV